MNTKMVKALSERMKLAQFSTKAWRPTRAHKAETEAENERHGLKGEARVSVQICDHPALFGTYNGKKMVRQGLFSLHGEAYDYHVASTMPTIMEGFRLVPAGKEFEHSQQMSAYGMRHDVLVAEFLADYEAEKALAPAKLKKLFDASMWPDKRTIEDKFGFSVRYLPCPSEGEWGQWLEETAKVVNQELMDRLVKAGRNLVDIFSKDGRVCQATLDNLAAVCELVGDGFNLTDDPIIAEASRKLSAIAAEPVENLSGNKKAKKEVAERTSEILSTLNGL